MNYDLLAIIFSIVWILAPIPLIYLLIRGRRKRSKAHESELARLSAEAGILRDRLADKDMKLGVLQERFSGVTSLDDELAQLSQEKALSGNNVREIQDEYSQKRALLERLKSQIAVYDERLAFAELGIYEPHFDFGDSEIYKEKIKAVREEQKRMISAKSATICPNNWTVDGSRSKGQTMINRQTRLTMRAFNNECEAAIANTRWNNVVAMEKRIVNASKQINAANDSMNLTLNEDYVAQKLDELHLTHEYRERLKIEKDERSELARAEREEKKLIKQAEDAEREEQKYQKLLERARSEAGFDAGKVAELERALQEAHANTERARAMAELTKSGYVYVISNIGSFGEDVVKIGMTRRLEPDDRVRELGDASVPFTFDTHAMIYSDEAPALEAALHKEFHDRRVNAANMRKEFFRVSLSDVELAVKNLSPDAEFHKDREAQDWHETIARRKRVLSAVADGAVEEFPVSI
jgi:hypothetical protein